MHSMGDVKFCITPLSMYSESHFSPLGIILLGITVSAVKGSLKLLSLATSLGQIG